MTTVEDLKKLFNIQEDKELAKILGRTKQAVSAWRTHGVPAIIERRANELLAKGDKSINLAIHGGNHHIDLQHLAEPSPTYSSTVGTIVDVVKEWPDKKARKLLKIAIEMDEDDLPKE